VPAPTDQRPGDQADLEVVSTRLFDAPREVVFRALTDPAILARWWGPAGFANTFHTFEPRPGGWWRFTMRGPDGAEYDIENRFAEVVPAERIVLQHLKPGHRFLMLMSFADEAGKTRLTWHLRFESAEEAEQARGPISAANEQNFERLQAQLDAMG
jgi:uncharacterized protein YndB with AHSA1/START domain